MYGLQNRRILITFDDEMETGGLFLRIITL